MRVYSYNNYCTLEYGLYLVWDDEHNRVEMCNDLKHPGTLALPLNWHFINMKASHG